LPVQAGNRVSAVYSDAAALRETYHGILARLIPTVCRQQLQGAVGIADKDGM